METYQVVRKYFRQQASLVLVTGLTLEEAQEHCNDPESSSQTCTDIELIQHTQIYGPWFDCYYKE